MELLNKIKSYYHSYSLKSGNIKSKLRPFNLIVLPLLTAILTYFYFQIIYPAIGIALLTFIITYFWYFFRQALGVAFMLMGSFIALVMAFLILIFLILKYNNGDIAWNFNIFEVFGLDRLFKDYF